jgi:undecaprenyl-diphosphatase
MRIGFEPTLRNVLHWSVSIAGAVVLLALTALLVNGRVYDWEVDVTRRLQDVDYPRWAFDLTANRLTNSDTPEGAAIILSVAALLWILRLRIESMIVLLISVPLHVAANFPKLIVERERPDEVIKGIISSGGALRSFPSGHAEFAITFYGFLIYIALLHVQSRIARVGLVAGWIAMALTVGFARIEVGEHWPLDVIAGYAAGIAVLSTLIWAHSALTKAIHKSGDSGTEKA